MCKETWPGMPFALTTGRCFPGNLREACEVKTRGSAPQISKGGALFFTGKQG